jgi:N-acetylglucosamine kinase-like BadF-type ATPase
MIYGAGVDVGSTQTKAVIVDESRRIVARSLIATGANVSRAGENAFVKACEAASLAAGRLRPVTLAVVPSRRRSS